MVNLLHKNDEQTLKVYDINSQQFLFTETQSLNDESFLVRQHWRIVEKYKDPHQSNALAELDMKALVGRDPS